MRSARGAPRAGAGVAKADGGASIGGPPGPGSGQPSESSDKHCGCGQPGSEPPASLAGAFSRFKCENACSCAACWTNSSAAAIRAKRATRPTAGEVYRFTAASEPPRDAQGAGALRLKVEYREGIDEAPQRRSAYRCRPLNGAPYWRNAA